MAHHFDNDEFRAVARVVAKHNPYFLNAEEEILHKMYSMAYELHEPGYCATAGFVLTAYDHFDGTLHVKPSVSHTILEG